MGEKNAATAKRGGQERKGEAGKKDDGPAIVLKFDLHCERCAEEVVRAVLELNGVKDVRAELTVTGTVDPKKIKTTVAKLTHQEVEIVTRRPKEKNAATAKRGGQERKGEAGKKDDGPAIVLKFDLHCERCAEEIVRAVLRLDDVKDVRAELTVTGTVDLETVKTAVAKQTHQKEVEIVSRRPKNDGTEPEKKPDDKKAANKKPKEKNAATAKRGGQENKGEAGKKDDGPAITVLKLDLHCNSCARKVMQAVLGFDGVEGVDSDVASQMLTVKGKVDPTEVKGKLNQLFHKTVEIISPWPKKANDAAADQKHDAKPVKQPDDKKAEDKKLKEKAKDGGRDKERRR